ncbi:MAG: YfhO family protein [Anaerolineae bacterium]|nr:YfhO family protein [Anaerolineae bacterium]
MQKNRKVWIPIAVLSSAVVVLFHRLLLGEVIFWGTPLLQFIPWRSFAFDAIRAGQSPLWNPYAGFGAPLLANYQIGIFYPPNWLYLIIPAAYANGLVGLIHVIWAGFGMRTLLRRWEINRLGQGVGMIAYALSGFLIARFGILPILCVASWLPWLIASVDALMHAEPGSWQAFNGVVQLSGIAALMLLAGHAQLSFYSLLMAGCYALWVFFKRKGDRKQSARVLVMALIAVTLGIGLAAVQLTPTLELMQTSQRAAGVDRYVSLSYSFWPWHFLTFLMPNLFGSPATGDYVGYGAYWEDAVFVGLPTLYFGVIALVQLWRGRKEDPPPTSLSVVPFFAYSLLPVLIFALGWNTPIFPWLFDHIPTFDLFNGPTRWMVLAVFALSVLGGIGADQWRGTVRTRSWAKRLIAAGLAMVIAVLAASAVVGESVQPRFILAFVRFGLSLAVLGGLILLYRQMAAAKRITAWELLVMVCLAADLVSTHWGLNPTLPASVINTRSPLADLVPSGTRIATLPADENTVKFEQYFTFDDFHSGDIDHWASLRASLLPNLFMLDGVSSINNFDPLLIGHYADTMDDLDNLPPEKQIERLVEYNVSVLLTPNPRDDLDLLAKAGDIYAYQTPCTVPRATFETCAPADSGVVCQPLTSGLVFPDIEEPTHMSFEVVTPMAGWLLLRDTYYPGWDAYVDDVYVETKLANGVFRAVEVPEGTHTVDFEYQPGSVRLGWMISGAAIYAWGIVWTMGLTRKQAEEQSGGDEESQSAEPDEAEA